MLSCNRLDLVLQIEECAKSLTERDGSNKEKGRSLSHFKKWQTNAFLAFYLADSTFELQVSTAPNAFFRLVFMFDTKSPR